MTLECETGLITMLTNTHTGADKKLTISVRPYSGATVCDTSVQLATFQVLASFAIQSVLIHNYPLLGATYIWWPR